MRELFCGCFGREPTNPPQTASLWLSESHATRAQSEEHELTGTSASVAFQALSALRARVACANPQSWAAKLTESATLIADMCDAGLASLMGLTAIGGATVFVVLASGGPAAAALGIGEILPWDAHRTSGASVIASSPVELSAVSLGALGCKRSPYYPRLQLPPVPLPPWEPPLCLRKVSTAHDKGPVLSAGNGISNVTRLKSAGTGLSAAGSATATVTVAATVTEDAAPAPPVLGLEPWVRVLAALQRVLPSSGPSRSHMLLLPLSLGEQQVGALLLSVPVAQQGGSPATVSAGGTDDRQKLQTPSPAVQLSPIRTSPAGEFPQVLLQHEILLAALAECVAECCLAPVLPAIDQVCSSCALLDASTNLQELTTCLSCALVSALNSELHVDFGVRLALLPSKDAPQGLLFEDPTRTQRGAVSICSASASICTASTAAATAPPPLMRSTSIPFLAIHRAAGSPHQQHQQHQVLLGSPRSTGRGTIVSGGLQGGTNSAAQQRTCSVTTAAGSWGSGLGGGGGGGTSSRVSLLQAAAARFPFENGGGPISTDDVLCGIPNNTQAAAAANAGALSLSTKRASPNAGSAAVSAFPASTIRRVLSPLQLFSNRGQMRASPLATASTLAAALLAGGSTTNDGASSSGTGGGRGSNISAAKVSYFDAAGDSGSTAAGSPYAVRLAGAIIPNVHSYLQDTEQPTVDVFAVLRRQGANPMSASLVTVAAWPAAREGAGAGAGIHWLSPTETVTERKSSPRQHLGGSTYRGGGGGGEGVALDGVGVAGTTAATMNTSCLDCTQPRPWDAASTGPAAAISAPVFVLYLTSSMPLPPQLLGVVRDHAMALLEVMLPTAARVLSSIVLDEWSCLCAQLSGGGANNSIMVTASGHLGSPGGARAIGTAAGRMHRSCSLMAADRSNPMNDITGTTGSCSGAIFMSGSRTIRTVASATAQGPHPASPTAAMGSATRRSGARTTPGVVPIGGTSQLYTTPRPAEVSRSSARNALVGGGSVSSTVEVISPRHTSFGMSSKTSEQLLSPIHGGRSVRMENGLRDRGSGGATGHALAAAMLPSPAALPSSNRGSQRVGGAVAVGGLTSPVQQSGPDICHPLETFPSSSGLLALEEDDEELCRSSAMGEGPNATNGTAGATGALLLSTVLSDGLETAKAARQAQLDIMVSTYHNALNKARNDAGALGGLHAEDDVRSLRLIKTIGSGGCSVVLLARLHSMPVAVKVILPPPEEDSDSEEDEDEDQGTNEVQLGQGGRGDKKGGKATEQKGEQNQNDDVQMLLLPPSASLLSSPFVTAISAKSVAAATSSRRASDDKVRGGGNGGGRPEPTSTASPALGVTCRPRASAAARQVQMRLLMRGARELAVMTSISHPNIVQVYSYCTRVVVQEMASGLPKLDIVAEGTDVKEPICTALIMEYCDMGSLADTIDSGAFARASRAAAAAVHTSRKSQPVQSVAVGHKDRNNLGEFAGPAGVPGAMNAAGTGHVLRSGSIVQAAVPVSMEAAATAGTPSMRAIYLTLLEVALALRHLHSLSLVHSDVKPANVLLRSSATDPRGFTAKLTDFGFVNLIEQRQSDCGQQGSAFSAGGGGGGGGGGGMYGTAGGIIKFAEPVGTVTHMAPELFIQGRAVDSSIDIYAFGILMWEMSTGRAPYPEFADGQFLEVPYKVVKEGLRPRFPPETPLHYKLLAQECWASQPPRRPTAAALVSRLQRLLDLSCGSVSPGVHLEAGTAGLAPNGGRVGIP